MRRGLQLISAAALVAIAGCAAGVPRVTVPAAEESGAAAMSGTAIEVPGTAALNKDADASVTSVSCASPGNCGAGGYYSHRPGAAANLNIFPTVPQGYSVTGAQAFVVSQVRGTWGAAKRVRFPAALRAIGGWVETVSCSAPGYCTAGGTFADLGGRLRAFVVSEILGTWGIARQIPGTEGFSRVSVTAISCASPGNCSAAGAYKAPAYRLRMFVVSQVNGAWTAARPIRNIVAAGRYNFHLPGIVSMSCSSAGNCSAGGEFQIPDPKVPKVYNSEAFVISQVRGTWGAAIEVPGTAALNQGRDAWVTSVSCTTPGNCGAAGYYSDRRGRRWPFVVSEVRGTWRSARQAPGVAALIKGPVLSTATISSVSCSSAGNCSAGGFADRQTFVISQVNGIWRKVRPLAGAAALKRADLLIITVACGSPGNCSAAGQYSDKTGPGLFVAREVDGRWGPARAVPGAALLTKHKRPKISSVACDQAGNCSGGGNYPDGRFTPEPHGGELPHLQAFVISDHQ